MFTFLRIQATHRSLQHFIKNKQDEQYTGNVILKRFRETIAAVEKQ